MFYHQVEEGQALRRQRLSNEAINLAVLGRWEEAEKLNREIIARFPNDVEAYNRLGRALTKLGEFTQAREAYLKALELAPNNPIANRNIARLGSLSKFGVNSKNNLGRIIPELFVTESTKSGVVNLYNLASSEVLAKVTQGDEVCLDVERQQLIVSCRSGEYLGEVEPKHSSRLIKLIKSGNKYAAAILSVEVDKVLVIIKEVYQHPNQIGVPSFPTRIADPTHPYARKGLLKPSIINEEKEASGEAEDFEREVEDSGEVLPDGFSILEDINGREVDT
jgi:tetratricopeptide (TPR) repeat protein